MAELHHNYGDSLSIPEAAKLALYAAVMRGGLEKAGVEDEALTGRFGGFSVLSWTSWSHEAERGLRLWGLGWEDGDKLWVTFKGPGIDPYYLGDGVAEINIPERSFSFGGTTTAADYDRLDQRAADLVLEAKAAFRHAMGQVFKKHGMSIRRIDYKSAGHPARVSEVFDPDPPPADLPVHTVMSSFLTAARSNKVRETVAKVGDNIRSRPARLRINTRAPAFDFGDPEVMFGGPTVSNPVLAEMTACPIRLPYGECYFVYRMPDRAGQMVDQVCYLTETRDTVEGRSFLRGFGRDDWQQEIVRFEIPKAGWYEDLNGCYTIRAIPGLTPGDRDALVVIADSTVMRIAAACWVLVKPKAIRERTSEQIRLPKRLSTTGSKTKGLPPVVMVHIDHDVLMRTPEPGPGTGRTMPPHDRRKHIRRLRDGREIEVKACKIHGGSKTGRYYEVTH